MTNKETIYRQDVLDLAKKGVLISNGNYESVCKAINELPSVNPTKTGHWIDTNSKSFEFHRIYKCSECGNTEIEYPENICRRFRYCPNCGCRMVEPQESEET